MNPDIKLLWINALLSKKYKQGNFYLRTDEGFCYLGVLCDLYGKLHNESWVDTKDGVYLFLQEMRYVPPQVEAWAGINFNNPITYKGEKMDITMLNDDLKLSFEEIVPIIQEQL